MVKRKKGCIWAQEYHPKKVLNNETDLKRGDFDSSQRCREAGAGSGTEPGDRARGTPAPRWEGNGEEDQGGAAPGVRGGRGLQELRPGPAPGGSRLRPGAVVFGAATEAVPAPALETRRPDVLTQREVLAQVVSNACSSSPLMSGRGIQQPGLPSGALTPTSSAQALERRPQPSLGSRGPRTLSPFPSLRPSPRSVPAHVPVPTRAGRLPALGRRITSLPPL